MKIDSCYRVGFWLLLLVLIFNTWIVSRPGRFQYVPNSEWGVSNGTVVMDTKDATIYHITVGRLTSFNPLTARRREWQIGSDGKFTKTHDGY